MSKQDYLFVSKQPPTYLMVPSRTVQSDLVTKNEFVVYVPIATKDTYGSVKIGDYLTITGEGVLSLDDSNTLKEYLDIDDKVDKVDGKGLSTNDYTTEDKNKLAGLENYDDTILSGRINDIESVIPTGVSLDNKLTSESYVTEFVNSSIATNTATFRGTYETVNDLPNTTDVPDLKSNDYVFVIDNGEYKRYKYNGSWIYEYTLNNSSYTASQWAAINSGITSEKVALINPVNDSTITFTQGGVTKGSITLNQSTDATIALDAGGGIVTDVQVDDNSQVSSGVVNLLTVNNNYNSSTNKLVTANDLSGKLDKTKTKNAKTVTLSVDNGYFSSTVIDTNELTQSSFIQNSDRLEYIQLTSDGNQAIQLNKISSDDYYGLGFTSFKYIDNVMCGGELTIQPSEGIALNYKKDDYDIAVLQLAENEGMLGVKDTVNEGIVTGVQFGVGQISTLLYMEQDVLVSTVSVGSSGVALGVGDIVNDTENMVLITPTDFTWNGKTIATVDQIQSVVQSDWNQSDSSALDYIKNKPVLGTVSSKDFGTSSGNVPILDSNGKLASSVLPAIAITDTFVASTQDAMLSLTAEVGDVCVRTDLNKTYILKEDGASTLSHWQEMLTPTIGVTSVNGQTGAVTLTIPDELADLTQDSTHRTVTDTEKSTWNEKQDAISDLSTIRSGASAGATAVQDANYVHTDNNYTNEDKVKISNALTGETDPTVPAWAKADNKPNYDYSEITNTPDISDVVTHDDTVTTESETTFADNYYTKTQIIDLIYPIGSVFITVNNVNPKTYLPNTNWELIEDRFLLGAGSTYTAGATGGNENHTHSLDNGYAQITYTWQDSQNRLGLNIKQVNSWYMTRYTKSSGAGYEDGSKISYDAAQLAGSTDSSSNMPPYLVVYMWKRIPLANS